MSSERKMGKKDKGMRELVRRVGRRNLTLHWERDSSTLEAGRFLSLLFCQE